MAALLVVSGCESAAVPADPPAPPPASVAACRALADLLPGRVADAPRRETRPASTFVAAWGDPAIVLRCGVETPPQLQPTSELVVVNDVDWLPVQRDDGYVFTTSGRVANVEVRVPSAYAPETFVLPDLAPAITHAIPAATTPR